MNKTANSYALSAVSGVNLNIQVPRCQTDSGGTAVVLSAVGNSSIINSTILANYTSTDIAATMDSY